MSHWIEKAVVYQIYPLGFCGCEQFNSDAPEKSINRIEKILEWMTHLKYINVNTIYLGPVFESVEHGYDTTDYMTIDKRLGTNDDFTKVCSVLHENGFRIVLDGVFNHIGRDHFAFKDIIENGKNSKYCGWISGLNFNGRSPYNDCFSYEGWNGCYNLVKLNLNNPEVIEYLFSAIKMWIKVWDIDGIRFDAADCLADEFIKQVHTFTKLLKPDFWLMGEIIHGNYGKWANGEMFDSVTNYQCYKGIYSSHNDRNYFEIAHSIEYQNSQYGNLYLYNFVDNHDVSRIASILKNKDYIYCCYTLLYMMKGVPSIYYGSEFGVTGQKGQGANADAQIRPCLELYDIPSRDEKLLKHISALGAIRQSSLPVQIGSFENVELKNQTFLFKREYNGEIIYIGLNISYGDYTFNFDTKYRRLADRLTGKHYDTINGRVSITVSQNCSVILVCDDLKTNDITVNSVSEKTEEKTDLIENVSLNNVNMPSAGIPEGRKIILGGHYKHFKGGDYVVLNVAKDHETLEEQVVYMAIYNKPIVWVRPLKMFLEDVDDHGNIKPRFAYIPD